MRDGHEEFDRRGARVALVTMGDATGTRSFCERMSVSNGARFVCLADPGSEAYEAFGLGRGGLREMFGAGTWVRGARAALKGHTLGAPAGDVWQMPGAFVLDREGVVRYARYATEASDNPPNSELLEVLDSL